MKYSIFLLVFILGCASGKGDEFRYDESGRFDLLYRPVLKVNVLDYKTSIGQTTSSSATGFVIKETAESSYILTVAHAFSDMGLNGGAYVCGVDYNDKGGKIESAKIVFIDKKSDICIIRSKRLGVGSFDILGNDYPPVLSDIIIVGYPNGWKFFISRGTISSYYFNRDNLSIRFDGSIRHGNSGSPVFDKKNRVIGMATSMFDNHDGVAITGYEIVRKIKDVQMP